ncbi:hypothetical protein AeNC1_019167, partial [Aphanomyces euteiches]
YHCSYQGANRGIYHCSNRGAYHCSYQGANRGTYHCTYQGANRCPYHGSYPGTYCSTNFGSIQRRTTSNHQQRRTFAALNDPTIIAWDVLNEAVKDNGSDLKHDVFYNVLGPNYITQIFTLARKYAPKGVKLFYNDYGCETPGAKANKCFEVVSGLKSKGLIDGIGFQTHLSTSTNLNGQAALFKRYSDI